MSVHVEVDRLVLSTTARHLRRAAAVAAFAERMLGRTERGVTGPHCPPTEPAATFFDPKRKNYVRFDRQTGVAVVLRGRIDGPVHSVLVKPNRRPTPRWVPIRHRRE